MQGSFHCFHDHQSQSRGGILECLCLPCLSVWLSFSPPLPITIDSFCPASLPALHSSSSGWSPLTPLTPRSLSKLMIEPQGTLVASNLTSTDSRARGGHALAHNSSFNSKMESSSSCFTTCKDFKQTASASPKIPFASLTSLKDHLPWMQNYRCHF